MVIKFKVEVDPDNKLEKTIKFAVSEVADLTIPFKLMTREWFKSNRSIFDKGRKGPGKYRDLSPKYKKRKTKALGSPYPILRGFVKPKGQPARPSGKLADSMTKPKDSGAVSKIINKQSLILGTKVTGKDGEPYPNHLHFGTKKMPSRPFVLLGGEQVAPDRVNKRRELWVNMIQDFVNQKTGKIGK